MKAEKEEASPGDTGPTHSLQLSGTVTCVRPIDLIAPLRAETLRGPFVSYTQDFTL